MVLFAIPFAAIGLAMAVWIGVDLVTWQRMSSWIETPATIVKTDLKVHGDGGETACEVTAEYDYRYEGRRYTATRVSIHHGLDNVGSFHRDAHRLLSEHLESGRPFRCFINPHNPSEAVLFRALRWETIGFRAIFVVMFGGFGVGIFSLVNFMRRKQRRERSLTAAHPGEPWLWRDDWAAGRIVHSWKAGAITLCVFSLIWITACVSAYFMSPHIVPAKYLSLFRIALAIVAALPVLAAISTTRRSIRYGRSVFQMAEVPGVIGGRLTGVIHVSDKLQPTDGFLLTLNCRKRSGEDNKLVWRDEEIITRRLRQDEPGRTAVPVLFNIPYACEPSGGSPSVEWQLKISIPGERFDASFEVPVFKTSTSDPIFVPDESIIGDYTMPDATARDLRAAGVVMMPAAKSPACKFVFPIFQNLKYTASYVLMTIFVLAGFTAILYFGADIVFIAGGGLILAIVLFITCDACFYRSVVDISPLGITARGGWFGRGRTWTVDKDDIEKIDCAANEESGDKVYYRIELVRRDGKRITLGRRILGKRLAKVVLRQIEQAMGREPVSRHNT